MMCWPWTHEWMTPRWHWRSVNPPCWSWLKECAECGERKTVKDLGPPPVRFEEGREIAYSYLLTEKQRQAGLHQGDCIFFEGMARTCGGSVCT
jgi:hypothetical protein